jgi:hypothetical protein
MPASDRTFLTRVSERLRYGLAAQEAIDRLGRVGIVFCPYYVVSEGPQGKAEPDVPTAVTFAKLAEDQAGLVAGMAGAPLSREYVVEQMRCAACFGVFIDAELAGYSWASFDAVRAPVTNAVLFPLDERGAYLFDMYIARSRRGERLAPWLRYRIYQHLIDCGRDRIFSVTLANNNSSRRFKARLGAIEMEKRVVWGIKSVLLRDARVRALAHDPSPSPSSMRFRGPRRRA